MTVNSENLENYTITYAIKDLSTKQGSVISQSAVIRHFHRLNPKLVVKGMGSFRINHNDQSVTIKCKVAKRNTNTNPSDCVAKHGLTLPDVDEVAKLRTRISELETKNAELGAAILNGDVGLLAADELAKFKELESELRIAEGRSSALQKIVDGLKIRISELERIKTAHEKEEI